MSQGREEQVIERWIHEKVDSINLDVVFLVGKLKLLDERNKLFWISLPG